jgi:NAD+ kinase
MSRAVVSPAGRRRIFARGFHSMKIAFLASAKGPAQQALSELMQRHGQSDLSQADYVVAIGGDGTALKALHAVLLAGRKPVFACAPRVRWGFSQTAFEVAGLLQRLRAARSITLHPLRADAGGDRRAPGEHLVRS